MRTRRGGGHRLLQPAAAFVGSRRRRAGPRQSRRRPSSLPRRVVVASGRRSTTPSSRRWPSCSPRVAHEQGRLDVLVNDIWGGDELTEWGKPFWDHSLDKGLLMLERAVTAHLITARHGAPGLVERKSGLIVEVTDGDTHAYRGNLYYDHAKMSAIRLAYAMACDLKETGVTAVAVTPGFLRSEVVLEHFGVTEENWRDAIAQDKHFAESETPYFVGRAIAALAADPRVGTKTGRVLASWTLADEYGFEDRDGRRPHWGRHSDEVVAELIERGGPFDPVERLFLDQRCSQADFDPSKREQAARIRALLSAASVNP